jgi:hypothetical protein
MAVDHGSPSTQRRPSLKRTIRGIDTKCRNMVTIASNLVPGVYAAKR